MTWLMPPAHVHSMIANGGPWSTGFSTTITGNANGPGGPSAPCPLKPCPAHPGRKFCPSTPVCTPDECKGVLCFVFVVHGVTLSCDSKGVVSRCQISATMHRPCRPVPLAILPRRPLDRYVSSSNSLRFLSQHNESLKHTQFSQAKQPLNLTSSAASNGTHIVVRITNPNGVAVSVNVSVRGLLLRSGSAMVSTLAGPLRAANPPSDPRRISPIASSVSSSTTGFVITLVAQSFSTVTAALAEQGNS